jgi:hypothetical protein
MLADFYKKTTVEYTITIKVDGVAPAFDVSDIITLAFKINIDDSDDEAILTKIGSKTGIDGEVLFLLTAAETDFIGNYYYEIKWVSGAVEKILESSTVNIKKRVFD